jgi:hypothetical protein
MSVFAQVKEALGGIFGRGLSAERRMEVEVTFGLIGFVAKADGLITSYESEFTNKLLDQLELNLDGRAVAMARPSRLSSRWSSRLLVKSDS